MQMQLFALDKGTLLWPHCATQEQTPRPEPGIVWKAREEQVSVPRRSPDTRVVEHPGSCAMTCFTAFPRWQTALHPRDELWVTMADQEFLRLVFARSLQVRDAAQGSLCCWSSFEESGNLGLLASDS